jgi:3-oxoacyl-[acyl-carrier-protein] synthase III
MQGFPILRQQKLFTLYIKKFNFSERVFPDMSGLKISAINYFLPGNSLSNEELASKFNSNPEDIFKRTGVRVRFHTTEKQVMSDMAFIAAHQLLNEHPGLNEKISALILTGHGYEYKAPVTSALLHKRLSLPEKCLCLDLPGGCTGYINALAVSNALLKSGMVENVLLLTADTPSYVIDKNNEELLSIFSDSGTASFLELNSNIDANEFIFGTDGEGADNLIVRNSGTRGPATAEWLIENKLPNGKMEMNGAEIFSFALKQVPRLVNEVLEKNNMNIEELDYFVFHQANSFLLEVIRKRMKLPKEKFFNDIEFTGNTVSSSLPIALKKMQEENKLKSGMKILLAGFGVGYSWGGTIITV